MKSFLRTITISLCIAVLFQVNSCAPEACLEETTSYLKASFIKNATAQRVAPDSLTLYGLNHENNKIYNKDRKVQPALFPLDQSTDNCSFVIKINGIQDTISFRYSGNPHLVSKECGYTINFTLADTPLYTKNAIDRIYISKRKITTVNEENIRIFY